MTIFEIKTCTQRTGCQSFKIETTSVADPGLQIRGRPGHQDLEIRRGGDAPLLIIVLVSWHNGGINLGLVCYTTLLPLP